MPQQVTDVERLQEYMHGVISRAEHHAQNVNEIVYALVGAVVCYKDADPIKVLTQDGEMKNVMWIMINRSKYALSFNHKTGEIELRSGTIKGDVLHSFSNSTPNSQVRQVFENLSKKS
jgi:hypothetical protein